MTTAFALPQFNLNGTSPSSVEDEYNEAMILVRKAREAVASCTCHPRDFQFQSPDVFRQAADQRQQQLRSLDQVLDYLEAWYWKAVDSNPDHS